MRVGGALLGVALLVTGVAGCKSNDSKAGPITSASAGATVSASEAPAWAEPAAYGFVLTRGCDKTVAQYQVTVKAGQVVTSNRLDAKDASPSASTDVDLGPVSGDGTEEIEVPTLKQLVDMAQTASDDGGQVSQAFDPADGHPVKVTINVADDGTAAETDCWAVTDYKPAA